MWVVTHVFAGLAIAAVLGGPWWLLVVAVLVAHVLMDLVPHWDYTVTRHLVAFGWLDFAASLSAFLSAWLVLGMPLWMAFMGLLSGAPDWDVLIAAVRGGSARKYFPSHWERFPHGRSGPLWGIGVQVAVIAASAALVITLRPY